MKHFIIDEDWESVNLFASAGNQEKWRNKYTGAFIKAAYISDVECKDYLVEAIGTRICEQINYPEFRYAEYEVCEYELNGINYMGCYSPNFLEKNEELVSFYTLLSQRGVSWPNGNDTIRKYSCLSNLYMQLCEQNPVKYLSALFIVDYLVGNIDRHLRNFTFIHDVRKDVFSFGPAFDFGRGMFEGDIEFSDLPVAKRLSKLHYMPFQTQFDTALKTYSAQYDLSSLLPTELDLSGLEFPSRDGKVLLGFQAKNLGIHVKGVDYA